MDQCDLEILAALEDGLPLIPEPFEEIGKRLGLTGEDVLDQYLANFPSRPMEFDLTPVH
jgi:DNA-binding Lrp family transcriptional regulator